MGNFYPHCSALRDAIRRQGVGKKTRMRFILVFISIGYKYTPLPAFFGALLPGQASP